MGVSEDSPLNASEEKNHPNLSNSETSHPKLRALFDGSTKMSCVMNGGPTVNAVEEPHQLQKPNTTQT